MARRINKKVSKVWFYCLAIVTFMVMVSLIGSADIVLAQEEEEEEVVEEASPEEMAAMLQYTLKYRFDKDLKVGDWVKYQVVGEGEKPGEHEIRVTKKEKGGVWIVEKFGDAEIHLLVDLKRMKLLKGFGFDEKGKKQEVTPLNDEELAEAVEMMKKEMEQQGAYSQFISWKKGEETEKVDIPAGSFKCVYLKPEYSEQYAKQMQDYIKLLQEHGKSDAEIDAEILKNESRLYFSKDVPRLLPMQIAIGWMPFIDSFEEVKGGLVECRHMSPLKLTAYSGQKK